MTSPLRCLVVSAALCAATASHAQTLKPGLWEVQNRMQGAAGGQVAQANAQMQQQLAALPPDQRKMVEEMMAKQGVRMSSGGSGMSVQVCLSKAMVERNELPMERNDCKTTTQPRTGNTMRVAFTCTSPPASGEGQVTFTSPEAYSTRMTVKTTIEGKPETMSMEGAGKWMSANCGSLKPFGEK